MCVSLHITTYVYISLNIYIYICICANIHWCDGLTKLLLRRPFYLNMTCSLAIGSRTSFPPPIQEKVE